MKEVNVVADKSFRFAVRVVNLYKFLCAERKEFILSKQLLRSGTAIGALIKESEHAQSRADFINKVNIALKEANETEYWLLLLKETDYLTEPEFNLIIEEARELIRLTASIVKTTRLNVVRIVEQRNPNGLGNALLVGSGIVLWKRWKFLPKETGWLLSWGRVLHGL